jgi:hypothetical protein
MTDRQADPTKTTASVSSPIAIPSRVGRADYSRSDSPRSPPALSVSPPLCKLTLDDSTQGETAVDDVLDRRRAVSDAAQWYRQQRQLELQRETLPASAADAKPHQFETFNHGVTAFCGVCAKLLWGFHKHSFRCTECGLDAHRHCFAEAPSCLGSEQCVVMPEEGSASELSGSELQAARVRVSSADGLARSSIFRLPDPFALISLDGKLFKTPIARKTLSPTWNVSRDLPISPTSSLQIQIFDAKKFEEGQLHGFLGMVVVPTSMFLDPGTHNKSVANSFTLRLRKRVPADVVTGTVTLSIRVLPHSAAKWLPPISDAPRHDSPMSAISPGQGWQVPEKTGDMPLIPSKPCPPVAFINPARPLSVDVAWALSGEGLDCGFTYTLAVYDSSGKGMHQDVYSGPELRHTAVGFKPHCTVQFVVKVANFFGCSAYSDPSGPVQVEEASASGVSAEDTRQHCPHFMAGFCFRGANCPMSHGSGPQSDEDLSVALLAATFFDNPDVQMAAAISVFFSEMQQSSFDERNLAQYKRDFHLKEGRFRSRLEATPGDCKFSVSRVDVFKSSFHEIMKRKPSELRKRLNVCFVGEGGIDYGGLAREWFYMISHEVFQPSYSLFEYTHSDDYKLVISPSSAADSDQLLYFQFVGRVLALAIFHKTYIDACFATAFLKRMLNRPINLSDMQDADPEVHRSLVWLLENSVEEIGCDMFFTVDTEVDGKIKCHELVPGGAGLQVTNANKVEFVRLMTEWRLSRGIERQTMALFKGFQDIVPLANLAEFSERELEFLLCGSRTLDMDDWKEHTVYKGFTATSPEVVWFWEVLNAFDEDRRLLCLQFCTGSPRTPLEGFQSLQGSDGPRKFCIQKIEETSRLPSAHTCFNRLDLFCYADKVML